MVENKHKLIQFKQLLKQNYSIKLSKILADVIQKLGLNDNIRTLS